MQIERDKKGNDEAVKKKVNELCVKVEKANDAFQVYKSGGKMKKDLYYGIIKFLVPLYDPKTAPNGIFQWTLSWQNILMEVKLAEYKGVKVWLDWTATLSNFTNNCTLIMIQ